MAKRIKASSAARSLAPLGSAQLAPEVPRKGTDELPREVLENPQRSPREVTEELPRRAQERALRGGQRRPKRRPQRMPREGPEEGQEKAPERAQRGPQRGPRDGPRETRFGPYLGTPKGTKMYGFQLVLQQKRKHVIARTGSASKEYVRKRI